MKAKMIVKWKPLLFYIFWSILMIGKGLGYSSQDAIFQKMCWIAIAFALLKVITTRYSRGGGLLSCILLNLIGLAVLYFSKSTTVLLTTITITAMKDVDYTEICKIGLWIRGPMFLIRTTLAISGIIDKQVQYFYQSGGIRIRYGLGYGQPNATHFGLFVVVVLCVLVYHYRLRFWHYIAFLAYNWFIFRYTDSRTGFLITALFLILSCLASSKGKISTMLWRGVRSVSNKAFIITTIVSIIVAVSFWKIDVLRSWGTFSSRFGTAINVISGNSINLFGTAGISTDLGMINFLYGDGLIFFALFLLGYYMLLKIHNKREDVFLMIACCCYAIYCLGEAYADSVLMNATLLYLGEIVSRKKI